MDRNRNRTFFRTKAPATRVVLAAAVAAASLRAAACLPSPDISGLPPYDGGAVSESDGSSAQLGDAGSSSGSDGGGSGNTGDGGNVGDSGTTQGQDGSLSGDGSSGGVGSITGVVVDYGQGEGVGVLVGARVSVPGVPSVSAATTDSNGIFTLSNVPAGSVHLSVSNPSETDDGGALSGIAYGTTELVVQVTANQITTASPVVHEGCFQVIDPSTGDGGALSVSLLGACKVTGAWANIQFDQNSFQAAAGLYAGPLRVEMIPLAYPIDGNYDPTGLAWATALPGTLSPNGTVGAAEYRVFAQQTNEELTLRTGAKVSIDVPIYTSASQLADAGSLSTVAWQYVPGSQWTSAPVTTSAVNSSGSNQYVTLSGVTSLGWWSVAAAAANSQVACVRGRVVLAEDDAGVGGLMIRAVGANYLGVSTATTHADGTYCLDVPAYGFQGNMPLAQYQVTTRDVATGGGDYVPSAPTAIYPIGSSFLGNTCASNLGCTAPTSNLALVQASACANGTLVSADGGAIPSPLDIEVRGLQVAAAAQAAGIRSNAYVGETTVADAGSFCAVSPSSTSFVLQAPGNPSCTTSTLAAGAATTGPSVCGGQSCTSVGTSIPFTCPQ